MDRRQFLHAGASLTLAAPLASRAFAAATNDARFVLVILRGGLDGLAAVPAYGESRYANLRGPLALDAPGEDRGILKLDGLFGLHPALTNMYGLYADGDLAVIHAVASPYRERSHFDGQKVLESGGIAPGTANSGWLNRALLALADESRALDAIAIAESVPLILRGPVSVPSWAPSRLPETDDDTLARVREIYAAADPELANRLTEALNARAVAGESGMESMRGPGAALAPLATAAARFLATDDGPRIAVIESSGWDTHANQGAGNGNLANRLGQLDAAIERIRSGIGDHWDRTTLVVATEFGRTVAANGTRGTDHGTAGCAFAAGGAVAGGRVIADWPGLAPGDLHEGRDLRPTLDLRALFKGVLAEQFGLSARALETRVFPDSTSVSPLGLGSGPRV